ncbi:hypothetical protein B484DRAFT_404255 [Ochromonadaceae sp. CCMP2298]|nr:hypothetical protein B484DRAFT_404255 [Ochromonadaceae sp. CCMP2298]
MRGPVSPVLGASLLYAVCADMDKIGRVGLKQRPTGERTFTGASGRELFFYGVNAVQLAQTTFPSPMNDNTSFTEDPAHVAADGFPLRSDCSRESWASYYFTRDCSLAFEHLYKAPMLDAWASGVLDRSTGIVGEFTQHFFSTRLADARRLQTGSMLTEFERPRNSDPATDPDPFFATAAAADAHLQSWAIWELLPFCAETDTSLASDRQSAAFGMCKTGYGESEYLWDAQGQLNDVLDTLCVQPTEVFLHPRLQYPSGFRVAAQPAGLVIWRQEQAEAEGGGITLRFWPARAKEDFCKTVEFTIHRVH